MTTKTWWYSSLDGSENADGVCARCETLPVAPPDAGRLHLRMPVAFTLAKMRELLARWDWEAEERGGILSVHVPEGRFSDYCAALDEALTSVERSTIRALFIGGAREPDITDYLDADSLQRVIARSRIGSMVAALADERLTAHFQPIVYADSLEIFAHEALLRVPPDFGIKGPADLFAIARDTDLLPNADLAARRTVIAAAGRQPFTGNLFINFTPSAIYDPQRCLRSTIKALDELGIAHDRIVFEVVESDEVHDIDHLLKILNSYRRAGFRIALDDLGAGFASLNLLHELRPDFMKLDMALVRDVDTDPFKASLAAKLIEAGRSLELGVIAEGVETAGELAWLREHGTTYMQGYAIAKPAAEMRTSIDRAAVAS